GQLVPRGLEFYRWLRIHLQTPAAVIDRLRGAHAIFRAAVSGNARTALAGEFLWHGLASDSARTLEHGDLGSAGAASGSALGLYDILAHRALAQPHSLRTRIRRLLTAGVAGSDSRHRRL